METNPSNLSLEIFKFHFKPLGIGSLIWKPTIQT